MADSESNIINFTTEQGLKMFDAMTRINEARQIKPLDQYDYIEYEHRYLYDYYNLVIGDCHIMVPPEFIHVTSEGFSQNIQTLRQENSQKQKTGYHKRVINMKLIFDGMDEINGYKVPAPKHKDGDKEIDYYYVDGLRELLAQFKLTPFLPITNELLNDTYKIYAVALQAITIRTIDGFQNALEADITLQEVDMMPYIEMPNIMFKYTIDWDLFRYYTQSIITDEHIYKNLQSLPVNKDHTAFKLSVINENVLQTAGGETISDTYKDTSGNVSGSHSTGSFGDSDNNTSGSHSTGSFEDNKNQKNYKSKEETILEAVINPDNYNCLIDSTESDAHISSFACGYSNMLTSIQMSDSSSPTLQYLGGLDTKFNIVFETTDLNVVGSIEQVQILNDLMVRNNPKIRGSIGFVKLETDLVTFCGSLFCTVESVETQTVPGIPGLYEVRMLCVSYDIAQSRREELNGFLPFDGYESSLDDLELSGDALEAKLGVNAKQTIRQDYGGLMRKIYQDNYAEWKLRTTMEVYPDLRLPTYSETNEAIKNINTFRKSYGLSVLPYNEYPIQQSNIHFGEGLNCPNIGDKSDEWIDNGGQNIYMDGDVPNCPSYNIFVDPDFYVFYPNSYYSIYMEEQKRNNDTSQSSGENSTGHREPKQNSSISGTVKKTYKPVYGDEEAEATKITKWLNTLKNMIGHHYCANAEGEVQDYLGEMFDNLGLITWGLKIHGILPENFQRLKSKDFDSMDIFQEVSKDDMKRGDIIASNSKEWFVVCTGYDKTNNVSVINVSERQGVAEEQLAFDIGHVYRILPLQETNNTIGTNQSNPYDSDGNQYPDENGNINPKKSKALDTTEGYSSDNPYGDDNEDSRGYNKENKNTIDASQKESDVTFTNTEQIKANEYDRRNRANTSKTLEEDTKGPELNQADISQLSLPPVELDGSAWTDGSVNITETKEMTTDEFNALALTIATECEGETIACKMAMAQYIYDSIQLHYKGQGITAFIKNNNFKSDKTTQEEKDVNEAKMCVQETFQNGKRWHVNNQVLAFTSMSNSNYAVMTREAKYSQIGSVNQHTYYGESKQSEGIGYNIQGYGVSKSSSNEITIEKTKALNAQTLKDIKGFGKPIYIRCQHFDTTDKSVGEEWSKTINSDLNRINTSFVDECQYSAKGRMVKAFPTFLFCILDDQSQWYDGRKLWTNYYTYKPVIDIQYHAANDMPTETATITVTNTFHNLDRNSSALVNYDISSDEDYNPVQRWLYKNFGMLAGGAKITNRMIQMHSILFNHTKLREGARVHLRMGYGSDPMSLAPIINGTVSGLTLGDQISITVTSDGHELIQDVTSDDEDDINNGALGLFGFGATEQPSQILSGVLLERESWMNHLFFGAEWFEGSEYHIEHFGLYINNGIDVRIYEQYDILTNIYSAMTGDKPRHWLYMYDVYGGIGQQSAGGGNNLLTGAKDEESVVFNQYNMTPWDIAQLCAQTTPEYVVRPDKYQFDSRLFYGLPFDIAKYRYDIINGSIYQECKSNTQMHYLDSLSSIIENQVSVTSKHSDSNAKVIYSRGGTPKTTSVIHSDDTIDNSKQSTKVVDSCISQDYLGWDAAYEFFDLATEGKEAARRLGISNLLYGWEQQYQGQLLCLGQPHIKPTDYLMVNDFYTSLNGLSTVREVIHSFSTSTGFTSSIIPGVIGFCPEQDTGNVELISSYLKLYGEFTKYSQDRKILKENSERFADVLASLDRQVSAMNSSINLNRNINNGLNLLHKGTSNIGLAGTLYYTTDFIYDTVRVIKYTKNLKKSVELIRGGYEAVKDAGKTVKFGKSLVTIARAMKGVKTAAKTAEMIDKGILAAGAAAAPETFGISIIIAVIIDLIINLLLDSLIDWLINRNVVVLLPLWWEGKPFISGVKDGEKILLIKDENAGSDENTGEDGMETDKDKISVEDN